ncbi:PHD-zinc-finger like domain-containing protein [Lipomyces arxii]|uniref:PHD-zinc-finger like domain-containing protein n=1 Tax=Lipomyces arxii TaxID=56418 RepID=UPI0034CFA5DD
MTDDDRPREERPYTDFYPDLDPALQYELLHGRQKQYRARTKLRPTRSAVYKQIKRVDRTRKDKFELPTEYVRLERISTEPDEPDTVEYDMDEQDDQFLIILNDERRRKYAAMPVSRVVFEIAMTMLEVEWHALRVRMPRTSRPVTDADANNDDPKCAICDDGEVENSNAIVFCDGCNVAVHQDCYGVPFIPEGQWLCRLCLSSPNRSVSCIFCPTKSGAFKQTDSGHWAHLLCALWIPEVSVGNMVYLEPVVRVDNVPRQRWKLVCYVCRQKTGACIQCFNRSCFTAFHVTCARRAKLYLKAKAPVAVCFDHYDLLDAACDKHSPPDHPDAKHSLAAAQQYYMSHDVTDAHDLKIRLTLSQADEGHRVVYATNAGAPVVPHVIYKKLCVKMQAQGVRKRKEFVAMVCKYWTLKKEIRRGATLLKRLQVALESMPDRQFLPDQGPARLEFATGLAHDLDALIRIVEQVVERERTFVELAEIETAIAVEK